MATPAPSAAGGSTSEAMSEAMSEEAMSTDGDTGVPDITPLSVSAATTSSSSGSGSTQATPSLSTTPSSTTSESPNTPTPLQHVPTAKGVPNPLNSAKKRKVRFKPRKSRRVTVDDFDTSGQDTADESDVDDLILTDSSSTGPTAKIRIHGPLPVAKQKKTTDVHTSAIDEDVLPRTEPTDKEIDLDGTGNAGDPNVPLLDKQGISRPSTPMLTDALSGCAIWDETVNP